MREIKTLEGAKAAASALQDYARDRFHAAQTDEGTAFWDAIEISAFNLLSDLSIAFAKREDV